MDRVPAQRADMKVYALRPSRRLAVLMAILALVVVWIWTDGMQHNMTVSEATKRSGVTADKPSARGRGMVPASAVLPEVVARTPWPAQSDGSPFGVPAWSKLATPPSRSDTVSSAVNASAPAQPLVTVPPPEFPYVVLGKQLSQGRWQVFLGQQGRTRIVGAGDAIDAAWRVDGIDPPGMVIVHVPTGEQRVIPIGEGA